MKLKTTALAAAALLCLSLAACGGNDASSSQSSSAPSSAADPAQYNIPDAVLPTEAVTLKQFEDPTGPMATIKTSMGDIEVVFFPDEAPKTVENFLTHAKNGYYDGLIFHRVMDGFMLQGGDPKGDGTGGESIWGKPFEDELSDNLRNFRGALSMANAGTDTNGSQFFIMQAPSATDALAGYETTVYGNLLVNKAYRRIAQQSATLAEDALNDYIDAEQQKLNEQLAAGVPQDYAARMKPIMDKYREVGGAPWLDNKHTVFGQVVSGMEVVDAIAKVETGENDKPVQDVTILGITVKE